MKRIRSRTKDIEKLQYEWAQPFKEIVSSPILEEAKEKLDDAVKIDIVRVRNKAENDLPI